MVYKIKSVSSNSTTNRFSNCVDNFIPTDWSIRNVQFIFHYVKYKLKRLKTRRVFNLFYLEHPTFITQYFGPYEAQLILNFLWSVVFFKLQKPLIALIINFIMIGLTAYLLWISWKNSKISFWLLVPYALWIIFAFYLNFYIVIKSKTR